MCSIKNVLDWVKMHKTGIFMHAQGNPYLCATKADFWVIDASSDLILKTLMLTAGKLP